METAAGTCCVCIYGLAAAGGRVLARGVELADLGRRQSSGTMPFFELPTRGVESEIVPFTWRVLPPARMLRIKMLAGEIIDHPFRTASVRTTYYLVEAAI